MKFDDAQSQTCCEARTESHGPLSSKGGRVTQSQYSFYVLISS